MKILIIGAGALGGYFGGNLLRAGRDVSFLVREGRARQLEHDGLNVKTTNGDFTIANPPHLLASQLKPEYDLIIVSCKGYDIESCATDFAPAVGPNTMILPLLNGMRHMDVLAERFGKERLLGGRCAIFATLDDHGTVINQSPLNTLAFGEQNGEETPRILKVKECLTNAGFDAQYSSNIMQEMWEKWVFIATIAGVTCLMRGRVCDIHAAGGMEYGLDLLRECSRLAALNGVTPRDAAMDGYRKILLDSSSEQSASMLKDMEKGHRIEREHIIGDFLARAPQNVCNEFPQLTLVNTHLKTYEARLAKGALTLRQG